MSIGDKTAVFGEADRCPDSRYKFIILALLEACQDVLKAERKLNDLKLQDFDTTVFETFDSYSPAIEISKKVSYKWLSVGEYRVQKRSGDFVFC